MSFDSRMFRNALGCFPTGVTVVTTLGPGGEPLGVTIGSFTSVSLEPPLVLFCLDSKNPVLDAFRLSGFYAVNVLGDDQRELSIRFSSRLAEKWKNLPFETWSTGAPILPGCLAAFECSLQQIHEGGDHQILVGRVERLACKGEGKPLVFCRGSYVQCNCEG